jgi:hypothetical protein
LGPQKGYATQAFSSCWAFAQWLNGQPAEATESALKYSKYAR